MKIKIKRSAFIILTMAVVFGLFYSGCGRKTKPEPTAGTNISDQYWIRVLLFNNIRSCEIHSENELTISDFEGKVLDRIEAGTKLKTEINDDKIVINKKRYGTDIKMEAVDNGILNVNDQPFRGVFRLVEDSGDLDIINALPIEAYLDGVVGAEMPSYWEAEALKAQAVAARTYSLYYKQKYGRSREWDVTRTQSTQVYRGVVAETSTVKQAVSDTYGQVMTCKYSDDIYRIFPAYYSSVCGGHTENSDKVFGSDYYGCLTGVKCEYCVKVARKNVFNWPGFSMSKDEVTERLVGRYPSLERLEGIDKIEVKRKGYLNRITLVHLVGSNGAVDNVRGEDLRIALDSTGNKLKSAVFKITSNDDEFHFSDGIGFGHGVGLCQCGAEGMARKGKNYEEILGHYYDGMKLHKLVYPE